MAERHTSGKTFAPFAAETLVEIGQAASIHGDAVDATKSSVQKALDALRDSELVWRAGRGEYALEDSSIATWLLNRQASAQEI